jgi:hypothetical protein
MYGTPIQKKPDFSTSGRGSAFPRRRRALASCPGQMSSPLVLGTMKLDIMNGRLGGRKNFLN